MAFIKKIPVSLFLFTFIPVISFLLVMSSLVPIYIPEDGFFGVAIALTSNYKWQLFYAATCFITTCAWFSLVGIFISEYRNGLIK